MEYREPHQKNNRLNSHIKIHRIKNIAATLRKTNQQEIASDILGSYTGMSRKMEHPEQDADDL